MTTRDTLEEIHCRLRTLDGAPDVLELIANKMGDERPSSEWRAIEFVAKSVSEGMADIYEIIETAKRAGRLKAVE